MAHVSSGGRCPDDVAGRRDGDFPNAGAGAWVEAKDDAIPVGAVRLCYFGQAADENGNWSPLGPLGCEDSLPAKIPVPLLAAPEAEGDLVNPVMRLRWFCVPDGLSRFRVILKPVAGPTPSQGGSPLTSKFPALAVSQPGRSNGSARWPRRGRSPGWSWRRVSRPGPSVKMPQGRCWVRGPDFTTVLDVVADTVYEVEWAAVDRKPRCRERYSKVLVEAATPVGGSRRALAPTSVAAGAVDPSAGVERFSSTRTSCCGRRIRTPHPWGCASGESTSDSASWSGTCWVWFPGITEVFSCARFQRGRRWVPGRTWSPSCFRTPSRCPRRGRRSVPSTW